MHDALGLSSGAATMFAIMVALGVAGVVALLAALFWPRRWQLSYRAEVVFALLLTGLVVYADLDSASVYRAYESALPEAAVAGAVHDPAWASGFDRVVTVYTYQWGFLFIDASGAVSRNATLARPGETILFRILSNDVIHGFNVPAARITTEVDPGAVRSIWIRAPERPGKYLIQCVDYCGIGHYQMKAWLVVEEHATGGMHHG